MGCDAQRRMKRRIMAGRSQKLPQSSLKAPSTPSSRACKLKRVSRGCEFLQACQPSCLGMQDASSSEPPPPPQSIPQFPIPQAMQCKQGRSNSRPCSTCLDVRKRLQVVLVKRELQYYIRTKERVGSWNPLLRFTLTRFTCSLVNL